MGPDMMAKTVEHKRPQRRAVAIKSFAERDDGFFKDVLLTNISYDGCELSGADDQTLQTGSELWVRKRGIAQVEVRWRKGDRVGCRFIREGA